MLLLYNKNTITNIYTYYKFILSFYALLILIIKMHALNLIHIFSLGKQMTYQQYKSINLL